MKPLFFLIYFLCFTSCSKNVFPVEKQMDDTDYKIMMRLALEDFLEQGLESLSRGYHVEDGLQEIVILQNYNSYSKVMLGPRKLKARIIEGLEVNNWVGRVGDYEVNLNRAKGEGRVLRIKLSSPYQLEDKEEIELYLVALYRGAYKHHYYRFTFDEKGNVVFLYSASHLVMH